MIIPFNKSTITEKSSTYILDTLQSCNHSGDGPYTKKCTEWIESKTGSHKVLMTTSGSHALDLASYLCGIGPGDEVIMPSYTFSSTANAFAGRGARIVFVDIRPDTMNIDENLIEAAITPKTKVVVPVHYAGVSCEMDEINSIAEKYNLKVVEDAAQAMLSLYKGKPCGAMSDFGCYSFHETKNFTMGEGGALMIRNNEDAERAEITREKGTNRSKFYRGEIDKYTWVDWGSSYLPAEILCAHLWSQLEMADEIVENRLALWNMYYDGLSGLGLEGRGQIELPKIPDNCNHNGHIFYIKAKDLEERDLFINWLKQEGIGAVFHYIPLHSAPAGKMFGCFHGEDRFTTIESGRLVRLPLYYGLKEEEVFFIIEKIKQFFNQ